MKISYDRQNYLVNLIVNDLLKEKLVGSLSRDLLFEKIRQGFQLFIREWEAIDQEVSYKIASIKKGIHPHSSEWDVLYGQFLEESFRKKSRLFIKK